MPNKWSEWTAWTKCSKSCGDGTMNRNRICLIPFYRQGSCAGDETEAKSCLKTQCRHRQGMLYHVPLPLPLPLPPVHCAWLFNKTHSFFFEQSTWITPLISGQLGLDAQRLVGLAIVIATDYVLMQKNCVSRQNVAMRPTVEDIVSVALFR